MPNIPRRLPLPVLFGLVLALLWSTLSLSGVLAHAEWYFYHALFAARGAQSRPYDIALVTIDEASLEDLKVWPPSRVIYAELIDGLLGAGARVVGIDVVFPQAQYPQTDAALADALKRHPGKVVLAATFQPLADGKAEGEELSLPLPAFREAAQVGFVNLLFDPDGAIHRFIPFHQVALPGDDGRMPSFGVAIARQAGHLPNWLTAEQSEYLINYGGPPGHFESVSLSRVLDAVHQGDRAFLTRFKDRVVLVGATSLRMQDQYPTPYSAATLGGGSATYMPGVEIHANIVHTLLTGERIRRVPIWGAVAFLFVLGIAAAWAFASISPWWGLLVGMLGCAGLWGLSLGLFSGARLWLDPSAPMLLLGSLYASSLIQHFTESEFKRRFYRRTFERYVSPEIVEELLRNPGLAPRLGGERREVTVLFSDVRNFTTISEALPPEAVVEFLNVYFTEMAEIIRTQHQGCIDKYIGDAILAVWGNVKPISPEEGALQGVRTALAMKAKVEQMRAEWIEKGYPLIEIGIGVNTGEAVVGNIGSPQKLEFGVIGDSINVASRLEGLTKQYGGAIIVSERTRELLGDRFACTYLDTVKVKGREQPVAIYGVERELSPRLKETQPS